MSNQTKREVERQLTHAEVQNESARRLREGNLYTVSFSHSDAAFVSLLEAVKLLTKEVFKPNEHDCGVVGHGVSEDEN